MPCRYLANNKLTGSIPPALGTLRNLYALNVMQNKDICGNVPSQVSDIVDGLNSTKINTKCHWEADGKLRPTSVLYNVYAVFEAIACC